MKTIRVFAYNQMVIGLVFMDIIRILCVLRTRQGGGGGGCLSPGSGSVDNDEISVQLSLVTAHCSQDREGLLRAALGARQPGTLIIFSLYLDPPSSVPSGACTVQ